MPWVCNSQSRINESQRISVSKTIKMVLLGFLPFSLKSVFYQEKNMFLPFSFQSKQPTQEAQLEHRRANGRILELIECRVDQI